jgi:hypothetical protein
MVNYIKGPITEYEYIILRRKRLNQLREGHIPFVQYEPAVESFETIFEREFRLGRIALVVQYLDSDNRLRVRDITNRDDFV